MFLSFMILALTEALIRIPLHYELKPSTNVFNGTHPFSFRRLSSSSSITTTNYENFQYYIQFGVGTPLQNFTGLLSLRSPWIFIDQKNCSQCRKFAYKFDSKLSSTFQNGNKHLTIESIGLIEGYTGKDTVNIGGNVAKSQGILLIDKENDMDNLKSDGLFGLGFSTSTDGTPSILSILYAQNDISHMTFSLYLNDYNNPSDLPDYGQSMLIIDGHDLNKYSAESTFTYIKATNSSGFWQIDFDSASFDGANYTSGNKAIISSGTSYILGPKNPISDILKRLRDHYSCEDDDKGNLYCNCDDVYPDFIVQMSGVKFTVKPAGYLLQRGYYCVPTFDYSTIANTWALGDAFLRRFYSFFDMENMKIGFATVGNRSQISYNNSISSNGSGGGSSGTNPGSSGNGSGTTNSTTGSGSNSSGTNSTGSGSSSGNSSNNSDSSDNDWKLILAITLSGLAVFMVWIFSLVVLFIKMRESRNAVIETQRQEQLRRLEEDRRLRDAQRPDNVNYPKHLSDESSVCKEVVGYPDLDPLKQCWTCGSIFPVKNLIEFSCKHSFCEQDLRQHLENNIKENSMERVMRCPIDNCQGEIGLMAIQILVSPNLWVKFNNYAISNLGLKNCPNCHNYFDQSQFRGGKCLNCQMQ